MNEKINARTLHFPQVGSYHPEIECTEKGAREDILKFLSSSLTPSSLIINTGAMRLCSPTLQSDMKLTLMLNILIHMHTQSYNPLDTQFCLHCAFFS